MPPSSNGGGTVLGRERVELDPDSGADFDRQMGGQNDTSAPCTMRRDGLLQAALIVVIECRKGLVEEPQRRRRHGQSSESEPPPLAGRQPAARPIRHRLEREGGERCLEYRGPAADAAATQCRPEDERFARRQPRLDAVLMADIVQTGTMTREIVLDRRRPP